MLGGRLDVLVNNAGAGKFDLKLADITPEDWLWHMNTNVNSVMYLTQMAIPHLEATKGNVVNISSIAGHFQVQTLHAVLAHTAEEPCLQSIATPSINIRAGHTQAAGQWRNEYLLTRSNCVLAAKRAVPGAPAYAISKAAVDALTTNSALELAPRVCPLIPKQSATLR